MSSSQRFGCRSRSRILQRGGPQAGGPPATGPRSGKNAPIDAGAVSSLATHGRTLGLVELAPLIWLKAVGLFVAGMMETMTGITQVSYRLAQIPDALQGRVNSVYRPLSFAAMSFGMVCGGVLIDLYGPRPTLGLVAAWIGAIALGAACSGIRTLRE